MGNRSEIGYIHPGVTLEDTGMGSPNKVLPSTSQSIFLKYFFFVRRQFDDKLHWQQFLFLHCSEAPFLVVILLLQIAVVFFKSGATINRAMNQSRPCTLLRDDPSPSFDQCAEKHCFCQVGVTFHANQISNSAVPKEDRSRRICRELPTNRSSSLELMSWRISEDRGRLG